FASCAYVRRKCRPTSADAVGATTRTSSTRRTSRRRSWPRSRCRGGRCGPSSRCSRPIRGKKTEAARSMKRPQWFWVAIAVSLIASLTPWGPTLLYPFKLFTTWVHESSHALMTLLVGGRVTAVTIEPNTSGLTHGLVPASRIARGLVASAGYLGAALVGCLLMAATRVERRARSILYGIGAFMLVTVVVWMRNLFGVVVVLAWGVALVTMARRRMANA